MEQIEFGSRSDVRDLEEKIENNAGHCIIVICRKKRYWMTEGRRVRLNWIRQTRNCRKQRNYKEQQDHYYKLRENKRTS